MSTARTWSRTLVGHTPAGVAPGTTPAWTPIGAGPAYQNAARQLVVRSARVTSGEDIFPFPVRHLEYGRFLYTADGHIQWTADGSAVYFSTGRGNAGQHAD